MEKPKRKLIILNKEQIWAIKKWITQNCHLELENIPAMVKSVFGIEALIPFYYHVVRGLRFSWKKLRVSPYNQNSPMNIKTCHKYAKTTLH